MGARREGWDPDEVAPPLGDVYHREGLDNKSSWWLVAAGIIIVAVGLYAIRHW